MLISGMVLPFESRSAQLLTTQWLASKKDPASLACEMGNTQEQRQQDSGVISHLLEKLAAVTLGENLFPNVLLEAKLWTTWILNPQRFS